MILRLCVLFCGVLSTLGNEAVVDSLGEVHLDDSTPKVVPNTNETMALDLLHKSGGDSPTITKETAIAIVSMIEAAKVDKVAQSMLLEMEDDSLVVADEDEMEAVELTPEEIVGGLAEMMAEMKETSDLFDGNNPELVQVEFEGEGPSDFDENRYKENPKSMVDDVKRELYYSFLSLAREGGYL